MLKTKPDFSIEPAYIKVNTQHNSYRLNPDWNYERIRKGDIVRLDSEVCAVSENFGVIYLDNVPVWLLVTQSIKEWQKNLKGPVPFKVVDLSDLCINE